MAASSGTLNADETEAQRLDRNWASLLQELRVAQTGVQLLTGFLLTLPFQQRFTLLDATMRTVYLVTVACSIGSTVLLVAPIAPCTGCSSVNTGSRSSLVAVSHRYSTAGLLLLGIALAGVAVVILSTITGRTVGWIAGAVTLVGLACFWLAVPVAGAGQRDTCCWGL